MSGSPILVGPTRPLQHAPLNPPLTTLVSLQRPLCAGNASDVATLNIMRYGEGATGPNSKPGGFRAFNNTDSQKKVEVGA